MPLFKFFLVFGFMMCLAKPFAGFELCNRISTENELTILVKSFTQRKQEYADNSEYDISYIQKQLSDPSILLIALFTIFNFLPVILSLGTNITNRIITGIRLSLFPPQQLYQLAGRLTI